MLTSSLQEPTVTCPRRPSAAASPPTSPPSRHSSSSTLTATPSRTRFRPNSPAPSRRSRSRTTRSCRAPSRPARRSAPCRNSRHATCAARGSLRRAAVVFASSHNARGALAWLAAPSGDSGLYFAFLMRSIRTWWAPPRFICYCRLDERFW